MALTKKPVVDNVYVLTNPEGLGEGVGKVATGTEVTVDSLHKANEAGVGGAVVVSWKVGDVDVEGSAFEVRRRASFSVADFNRLFSPKAGDDK